MLLSWTIAVALAWVPVDVEVDPLVRMPGTQPADGVTLEDSGRCMNCHADYGAPDVEPGTLWSGSMMSQAMRDPLFWAAVTVAAQDAIWVVGNPNATDLCLRCHSPQGWLAGRSSPTNGSAMTGGDFDGVSCDACHRLVDPHFADTFAGTREGNDWVGYWDESNASATPSQVAADDTYADDLSAVAALALFNGTPMYAGGVPAQAGWTEGTGGQLVYDPVNTKRASFADDTARHTSSYSRYHKSRYGCSGCHDVSNTVLSNLSHAATVPGDGVTVLPSEAQPAHAMVHIERTFSEFAISDFGLQGGAIGTGDFAPSPSFTTGQPGDWIASCQDCHMADGVGKGADKADAVLRPTDSIEHPNSGQPVHTLTGGNAWVPWLLASTVPGSADYDATNAALLGQGPGVLTMDLSAGLGLDASALAAGSARALDMLAAAATLEGLTYDPVTGDLAVQVTNHTGHKLISGFPEGRRMFLNIELWAGGSLIEAINPYDAVVGTLKGLPDAPLGPSEVHEDTLVYEVKMSSSLVAGAGTFHFVLADGRYKDNRIPPRGFRIAEAAARQIEPVWGGVVDPSWYSAAEYAGGYDDVLLAVAPGADTVVARLYYQTTSREYVAFLRDEINGTATSLTSPTPSGEVEAYVAQTDPWFGQLAAWGTTIWDVWDRNKHVPGAAPVLMAEATWVGASFQLDPATPGQAGVPNTVTVTGGPSSGTVHLVVGIGGSTTAVPGCPGLSLDLGSAAVAGSFATAADGSGGITLPVPAAAAGLTRVLQVVDVAGCAATNAVEQTFD